MRRALSVTLILCVFSLVAAAQLHPAAFKGGAAQRGVGGTLALPAAAAAQSGADPAAVELKGLNEPARVVRDEHGIAHIFAQNDHDLYFLQGCVHSQDRLFQMDVSRREASGTLAELVGPSGLASDVELRTIGLRRAAVRSFAVLSRRGQAIQQAYADGVNACVPSPLPPEYAALSLTHFDPWTPVDSLAVSKLLLFSLGFDLDIGPTIALMSYQKGGAALGFDGTKLFFEDLDRAAPFDAASTIPDASREEAALGAKVIMAALRTGVGGARALQQDAEARAGAMAAATAFLEPRALELAEQYLARIEKVPAFQRLRELHRRGGSNEWAVSGENSASGEPLLANDPHLMLGVPTTFYPIHLRARGVNVIGSGFAGVPFVIVGQNRFISWGATVNPLDLTDTYQEQIMPDPTSPSGFSTVFKGNLEHILPIPEMFRTNNPGSGTPDKITVVPPGNGIPPATLIVPRRNNGPLISFDPVHGVGLSIQWVGFSGTREVETFLAFDEARNLRDFRRGLTFFSSASQNFAYSDVGGNIAYFTSGEMPIREDLQAGAVGGLPPFFIRNGTGGNEWLAVMHPQPNQALPYEILPFAEMPHIIDPPAGFFVNSNNDPVGITLNNNPLGRMRPGGGIYYLNYTYSGGYRAGRITQRIRNLLETGHGKISFEDMQDIQADVTLLDAQAFVPYITQAFRNAQAGNANPILAALGENPAVAEAAGRLAHWDFTTPTGIPEGYDDHDVSAHGAPPSQHEINESVVAAIYSVWRGQFIANTIDAVLGVAGLPKPGDDESLRALRHLLDNFAVSHGVGASGVNFFNVPGVSDPAARRDIVILQSLANAVQLMAGNAFADAFGHSTSQSDYRWGKLHRIVFAHILDGPFNIPPAGGAFPPPLANPKLPGIPTDGGFETVDAATHSARAAAENDFMFGSGPNDRFVSQADDEGVRSESVWPGGTSGILGSPRYFNMLPQWLVNEAFPLLIRTEDVLENAASITRYTP